jgi:hypothetical protein
VEEVVDDERTDGPRGPRKAMPGVKEVTDELVVMPVKVVTAAQTVRSKRQGAAHELFVQ